ncbi:uncharacterized protein LOC141649218 [Silene latifolia]|uniref:uncharacterized protein LOC141649218 n=1 Tax=Silene latifolia TaxID=37657 RepID=UPI003D784F16
MSLFAPAYTDGKWLNSHAPYNICSGYNWLRQPQAKVPWRFICWNSLNIPKTAFIFWALMHQRLLTKDRLLRMGLMVDTQCDICRMLPEDHQHLFSGCVYFKECSRLLQQQLKINVPVDAMISWYSTARISKLIRRVVGACYVSMIYQIWKVRNEARLKMFVRQPSVLIQQVISDVKNRMQRLNKTKYTGRDKDWICAL